MTASNQIFDAAVHSDFNIAMPNSVYALVGEDSFLQLEKLAAIRAGLGSDIQISDFDGERAELSEVFDELRSFAMFGGSKLIVIRSADAFVTRFRSQLEDYLAAPSDTGTLVLRMASLPANQKIYKLIGKVGQIIKCEPPAQRQLPQWIIARGKSVHQLVIDSMAAGELAELVGNDLGRLDNELAKLALQTPSGKVTSAAVLASVSFQREQEIKDMTTELAKGKPAEALRRWRHMTQMDSTAEFRAVTWLTIWLDEVGLILANKPTNKFSWKYGTDLPVVLKFAKTLNGEPYQSALTALAEMDQRAKTGLGDLKSNVEQFILRFANKNSI